MIYKRPVSRKEKFGLPFCVLILAVLLSVSGCTGRIPEIVDQGTLSDSLTAASGWPLPNLDYNNSRNTAGSPVDSRNVRNLSLVWTYPVSGAASNPLIFGDIVIFQDLESNIVALDLASGKVVWKKDYALPVLGPNGVGAGDKQVFVPAGRYQLAALSRENGTEIWRTNLSDRPTVSISIQPLVAGDLVFVSTVAGGEGVPGNPGGGKGVIYAIDQESGKIRWAFDTVNPADLWGNPEVNYGGGSYQTPGLDRVRNLIFFGTANSGPSPGTDEYPAGSSRPGPNLYTNSILALRADTGTLAWATQVYPHDLFNYGMSIPPLLAEEEIGGISQDIVIAAGKTGRVYALNRTNGAILWVAVVGTHENDQLAVLHPGTTRVWPGGEGGVETPMAYASGRVYVPVINMYADYTPTSQAPGDIARATGGLVAIEASSGKIIWETDLPSANIGAATVVNDLVFTGTLEGTLLAFDRDSGEELWRFQGSPGITGWPAISGSTLVFVGSVNQTPCLIAFNLPGQAVLSRSGSI
jgi:outer membrane protein assembly factor BamB